MKPDFRHYVTRSKRFTKNADGSRHFGWSVRAARETYDSDHAIVVCSLDVTDATLRKIEGLLYAR